MKTHTFFHVTAQPNCDSIREKGLLTSERGKNKFGLDEGVSYGEVYDAKSTDRYKKDNTIHLTDNFQNAAEYGKLILREHHTAAVIYKVSLPRTFPLKPDPEDPLSVIATQDIPNKNMSVQGFVLTKKQSNKS